MATTTDSGPLAGATQRIAYLRWEPPAPRPGRPAVLLLHGSPGESSNFDRLAPFLQDAGYEVVAPDLPGFGESSKQIPSYSFKSHAQAVKLLMDRLGLERVHVVGWSQGGGAALELADLFPDRVASLTLMASIGAQEAEGSGSYAFEHFKYGVGYVGLVLGAELVPHFGILGSHDFRNAFMRNFWDSDQRPLRDIMQRLKTPTLILHGRHDFLTPEWGAQLSHRLIQPSRLVILDASHFLPFLQPRESAEHMLAFFARHDQPGLPVLRQTIDLATPADSFFAGVNRAMLWAQEVLPWWLVAAVFLAITIRDAEAAAALAGVVVAMVWVDTGVACVGLFLGLVGRAVWAWNRGRRPAGAEFPRAQAMVAWKREIAGGGFGLVLRTRLQPWRRDEAAAAMARAHATMHHGVVGFVVGLLPGLVVGSIVWTASAFVAALVVASTIRAELGDGLPMLVCAAVCALLAVRTLVFLCTWTGRQRIKATLTRTIRHEFWPGWAYYSPLVPWLAWLGLRHGGVMCCTCVNPVIGAGGGVVGESKHAILRALGSLGPAVLAWVVIDKGDAPHRFQTLRRAMERGDLPRDYPVVLKPDAGQRGYAVRIARSDAEASDYLARMDRTVIAQAHHAGPVEVGVMWVRDPQPREGRLGHVFSLTTKHFSDVVGDGRHTVEQLIYRHRRFRCQADTLLTRLADRRLDVPALGEKLRLVSVGNHSQGAIFRDAAEHITPEFEAWIDRAAAAFSAEPPPGLALAPGDNGLDFGRFDIRVESIEKLRRAEGLAIIELNGTAAESTNIYDPDRSLFWSWGVLLRQWATLYALGGRRRRTGVRAMGPLELRRAWRDFDRDRPAMRVAD